MMKRDHKAEYQRLSPEAKAKKIARNQLPEVKQKKREYYQRDKHLIKERYEKNFSIVVKYLEERDNHEGCIGCGSKQQLELDHINQEDKEWNPRGSIHSKKLSERFWKEIDKCQLLCYDCHREKTGNQFRKV
jgi:5-methylcytosine-specific restriction endonuclease McrA